MGNSTNKIKGVRKESRLMYEAKTITYATDYRFQNKYKGQKCLIIGGKYRSYQEGNEYVRCKTLDKWRHFVIACNSGYKTRKVDCLCWIDISFSSKYQEELRKLDCLKFVAHPTIWEELDSIPNCYGVTCGNPQYFSRSFDGGIFPHGQSGIFAINVAIALGFEEIYLTGFYPEGYQKKAIAENYRLFDLFKVYVTDYGSHLMHYFKYKPLSDILKI